MVEFTRCLKNGTSKTKQKKPQKSVPYRKKKSGVESEVS